MGSAPSTREQPEQRAKRLEAERRAYVVATVVRTEYATSAKPGAKAVIDDAGEITGWIGGGCAQPAVRKAALAAIADGRPRLIRVRPGDPQSRTDGIEEYRAHCHSGGTLDIFIEPVLPRPALLVLGASPVGQVLARLAKAIGYEVTVACQPDDVAFYEDIERVVSGFEQADASSRHAPFVVVATQGRGDRAALEAALRCDSPYVALVASRRKAGKLKAELIAGGLEASRVAAVRAPAGLDIAATMPEEIAVSILAEIVQLRHAGRPRTVHGDVETDDAVVSVEVVARADCGDIGAKE